MDLRLPRRRFLTLSLLALGLPRSAPANVKGLVSRPYEVDVSVLFNLLTFAIKGTISEEIDPTAGRYRFTLTGQGTGVSTQTTGVGVIQDGRFKPTELMSVHTVRGRENRTSLTYDYQRGLVEYHSVSYTLLLGRRRQVDDVLRLPEGQPVDDLASAYLNFAANKLEGDGAGSYRALVVRRAWKDNEGPDDVSPSGYRAMLAPVRFQVAPDPATGGLQGQLDMTSLSSWARPSQPARVSFDAARHLESFQTSLILGTTITVQLAPSA